MKKSELQQIIREEIAKVLNEKFKPFSDLEYAINQHEKGNDLTYDETKVRNIFNQLSNPDQVKARKQHSKYFGK